VESNPGQLAERFEKNSMLVGCYPSPFKFPKRQCDAILSFRHPHNFGIEMAFFASKAKGAQ